MGMSFHVEQVRNGFIICSCPGGNSKDLLPFDNFTVIEGYDYEKLAQHLKYRFTGKHFPEEESECKFKGENES